MGDGEATKKEFERGLTTLLTASHVVGAVTRKFGVDELDFELEFAHHF